MVLMIDNYDSFTFNLVQYLGELGAEVRVVRNDELTVESIEALAPSHLVLSPGPCTPNEAGITLQTIERLAGRIPILGVCLGHQAIGQAFGGKVVRAKQVMHGKVSRIRHDGSGRVLATSQTISSRRATTRWWSSASSLPACLEISAESEDGEIMGLRHRSLAGRGRAVPSGGAAHRARPPAAAEFHRRERELMKQITIAEAIQRTVEHREVFHDEMLHVMRQIMRGELTPGADRRLHHRPAREEGDHRRDRRRGAGDARAGDAGGGRG